MTFAETLTISGDMVFENVKIFDREESIRKGYGDYFEDAQIVFSCKEGTFVMPSYNIQLIRLSKTKTMLPTQLSHRVKRITISGNISYENCMVLKSGKHEEANIPLIFAPYDQFVFSCKDGTFITIDFSVALVEL